MAVGSTMKSPFEQWANQNGIQAPNLVIDEFDGERGVIARQTLSPSERVLAVPSNLALQVTTVEPCPSWADEAIWRSAPWYQRLALSMLHEEAQGSASSLSPWLAEIPKSFTTPIFWNEAELTLLGYAPVVASVASQRAEWDKLHEKLQGWGGSSCLSKRRDDLFRALSAVRSRSFSGPYARGNFRTSLVQLFVACTVAGAAAINGVDAEMSLNGFLAVMAYVISNDFVFSRFSNAKRYVLCPYIDMMNHAAARSATDVAYEYFSDKFAVVLDAATVPSGQQALICYGPRSNDALLQYYGFVESDNPHDEFVISREDFLIALADVTEVEPSNLRALADAKLPATFSFTRDGASGETLRAARLVLQPAEAAAASGRASLSVPSETSVNDALAAIADAQRVKLAALPSPFGTPQGFGAAAVTETPKKKQRGPKPKPAAAKVSHVVAEDATPALIAAFREEKQKVLSASVAAIQRRSADGARAGHFREPTDEIIAPEAASSAGLGMSRIS